MLVWSHLFGLWLVHMSFVLFVLYHSISCRCVMCSLLSFFCLPLQQVVSAVRAGVNPSGNSANQSSLWDLSSSFFFAGTVITTIGKKGCCCCFVFASEHRSIHYFSSYTHLKSRQSCCFWTKQGMNDPGFALHHTRHALKTLKTLLLLSKSISTTYHVWDLPHLWLTMSSTTCPPLLQSDPGLLYTSWLRPKRFGLIRVRLYYGEYSTTENDTDTLVSSCLMNVLSFVSPFFSARRV